MARQNNELFRRSSLSEITDIPDDIISVYTIEKHIWADGGSNSTRKERKPEPRTVREFLIDPVRPFLNDIFRQMAAPFRRDRSDNPIGQGYWIQAEFGSGKSHLLSFVGALALGSESEWDVIKRKEEDAGLGRRESLYLFYENGLAKKTLESRGILVAVKTLVGLGSSVGIEDQSGNLTQYILDAVAEQYNLETGETLPLYPTQQLAERFLTSGDLERYRRDLTRFLRDPVYFDADEQEDIEGFLSDLQQTTDADIQRDCGTKLWRFYAEYLRIQPRDIKIDTEPLLEHMVERLLDAGYAGLLIILDEVSLYMQQRSDVQRVEDEKTLVVLTNRLAKVRNLPVWTVCAAQQAIESRMAGVKNIIADERLKEVPLLNKQDYYYDIALSRVRRVTNERAVEKYYEDYKHGFTWTELEGSDKFARFFPFYPPAIDVVRAISYKLTTVRSALYFMLQTLKTQRKRDSRELISLWALFDDVIEFEEDPSGTTRGITSVKSKFPDEWKAYETAKHQLNATTQPQLKAYRSRCERILKTLFLYHVANMAPNGLSAEELMNCVMEWKDHERGQQADRQDNLGHYELLADALVAELAQMVRIGKNYRFNPTGSVTDPRAHFDKARAEAVQSSRLRKDAWEALLDLTSENWQVTTALMRLDLTFGVRSVFREIAPADQTDLMINWHGRMISGRVYMRDLRDTALRGNMLPQINSADTNLDYAVFISSTPAREYLQTLASNRGEERALYWSPDELNSTEETLLIDFTAYRTLVAEFRDKDTQEAREVLEWVQSRLRDQMGTIYRIVADSYSRGQITAVSHSALPISMQGELRPILEPLIGQVLDTIYVSSELNFHFQVPFDDTAAVNVINGIVKMGEIPRGTKPTKETSASQNYSVDLGIMRRGGEYRLDTSTCRYTTDLLNWLEEKLSGGSINLPAKSVYKNFMGIGGPNSTNYGLTRRLIQLYLLCLVRDGKIRISLNGRNMPVEIIDYTNIASIDFKSAVLDAFEDIQRLRAPEGWELLAPFAAKLLSDDTLLTARQDAEIQIGLTRVLESKAQRERDIPRLRLEIAGLFTDIVRSNPFDEALSAWETFFKADTRGNDPLALLLHALDTAFSYRVYQDDRIEPAEVDDFAARLGLIRQAELLSKYRDDLRAADRYARYDLPQEHAFDDTRQVLERVNRQLDQLERLSASETELASQLLDPVRKAIDTYSVNYLNAFDVVMRQLEYSRKELAALPNYGAYRALKRLAVVSALGADPLVGLETDIEAALNELAETFPDNLTSAALQRELTTSPEPARSKMTLRNAGDFKQQLEELPRRVTQTVDEALRDKAVLLVGPAMRSRLVPAEDEPFIAALLSAADADTAANILEVWLTDENIQPDPVEVLERALKTVRLTRVRLSDFRPSKTTLEMDDIDTIVAEFRAFIEAGLRTDGADDLPMLEIE